MRRTILATLAVLVVLSSAGSVWAVVFDRSVHYIKSGYHRNVAWPWPYICPDRMAVRQPFAIMIENGWRRQNLLGEHHFDHKGERLTTAGELKVRWILTQAPPEHRTIFIERAFDPAMTANRLAAAREFASHASVDNQMPQIYETTIVSEGRPASVVDSVNVRFQESAPPPVLPASTYTGTGQ